MDEPPPVSVIIPVYNAPDYLRGALASVTDQTYPEEQYEVVVVDNDSDDNTIEVARQFAASHPDVVTVTSETDIQTSYAARNTGLSESDGEIIAFIDADVTVDRAWLENGVETMRELDAEYLACDVQVENPDRTLVGKYEELTAFPIERYIEEFQFAPTCGLFVARSVFRDVGTFDERLVSGGDAVFGKKVADSGRELHYSDDVRVYHPARSTVRSLVQKHVRVGRGLAQRRRWYSDRTVGSTALNPARYLPVNPFQVPSVFESEWNELSAFEKLGMYVIVCIKKLSRTAGKLREFLRMIGRYPEEDLEVRTAIAHEND